MASIFQICSSVSLACSTKQDVSPHEYASLVIIELLGNAKEVCKADDAGKYEPLLELLKAISKRIQRHNYSKEALIELITEEYLKDISISELGVLFHESSVIKFPSSLEEPMVILKVSAHPPRLRTGFGDDPYVPSAKISSQTTIIQPTKAEELVRRSAIKSNGQEVNKKLEDIYDSLISGFGCEPKYEWQFLLSNAQYLDLKQKLTQLPAFPPTAKLSEKASKAIAVYVSEFYKREYDGSLNAFKAIQKDNKSDIINNIKGMPVYSKVNDALLFSLYVDGGLPVSYLAGKLGKDNDSLISFLRGLLAKDDFKRSLAFANLPKKSQDLNNTAFKGSLRNKGSIYEQITAITAGKEVFSPDDVSSADGIYATFLKHIRESEEFSSKFWISYIVFYDSDDEFFSIRPVLHLRPEQDGERHYAISTARLASWGLGNIEGPVSINIHRNSDGAVILKDEKGRAVNDIVFIPCMNHDYVEHCRRDTFFLPDRDKNFSWEDIYFESYTARIDDSKGNSKDITGFLFKQKREPYIKLFSRDGYEWQSYKGNKSFPHAAILFDPAQCMPVDGNYLSINATAGLAFYDYSIDFIVKKKKITFFNSKGRIAASPKNEFIHTLGTSSILSIPEDGLYEYLHSDGISEKVLLIKDIPIKFDVMSADDNVPINTDCSVYLINTNGDRSKYDGAPLPLGYIKFEITFDERYFASVPCFVLPSSAEIKAESNLNKITFANFSELLSVKTQRVSVSNGTNKICTIRKGEDDDFIQFEICTDKDDGSLFLQTYYPANQTIFKAEDGTVIKAVGPTKDAIPVVFAGHSSKTEVLEGRASTTPIIVNSAKVANYILEKCFNVDEASSERGRNGENGYKFTAYSQDLTPSATGNDRVYEVMRKSDRKTLESYTDSCRFFFLDFDTLSVSEVPAETNIENNTYVRTLDVSGTDSEGMLFQSLKGKDWAPYYFRPRYVPGRNNRRDRVVSAKRSDKMYRIFGFSDSEYKSPRAFKSFEIACEHKLYFSSMDILSGIICEYGEYSIDGSKFKTLRDGNVIANRIVNFFKSYIDFCKINSQAVRYDGLWRLAKEFIFDWLYIPKSIYLQNNVGIDDLRPLFMSNPNIPDDEWDKYLAFIDNYSSITVAKSSSSSAAEKIKDTITGPRSMFNKRNGQGTFSINRAVFLDSVRNESWDKIIKSLKINAQ